MTPDMLPCPICGKMAADKTEEEAVNSWNRRVTPNKTLTGRIEMADELKPCPFCGAKAIITEKSRGFRVECSARFEFCPMNMRTHHHQTPGEAAEAWNTRVNPLDTVSTADLVHELEERDGVESYEHLDDLDVCYKGTYGRFLVIPGVE